MEQINWPASLLIAAVVVSAGSAFIVWCCCHVGKRADREMDERRYFYRWGDDDVTD